MAGTNGYTIGNSFILDYNADLDAAIKSNLTPCKEYFLQGSIADEHVGKLLELLQDLCGYREAPVTIFRDYEAHYHSISKTDDSLKLRVRRPLLDLYHGCTIRYVGTTELGAESPVAVRTSFDVKAEGSVDHFLDMISFAKELEFVSTGYAFKKGRMNITASRISKAKQKGCEVYEYDYFDKSHLVEMSVIEPVGKPGVGNKMRQFADRLLPLIHMTKPGVK